MAVSTAELKLTIIIIISFAVDTLYTVRFREVSGLSSFKNFFKIRPLVAEILHIV